MNDLQTQISTYQKAHQTATRAFIAIGCLLILILVYFHFYGHTPIQIKQDRSAVEIALDSLRQEGKLLHDMRISDSIRISDIQDQVDQTQDQLDNINKRYATQRTTLDHSSINTRVQFLSNHLPKSSGSR